MVSPSALEEPPDAPVRASGNKVIFVNSISMGLAPMKSGELLPRIKRKLKSYAKFARTTEEGIT